MPKDFLSHSIRDSRPAIAVKRWRVEQPGEGLSLQQAIKSTSPGSQVCELLAVYLGVLDTVSHLPPVPLVLRRHGGRLHFRPCPRWQMYRAFAGTGGPTGPMAAVTSRWRHGRRSGRTATPLNDERS
jgi:hypothetical protein